MLTTATAVLPFRPYGWTPDYEAKLLDLCASLDAWPMKLAYPDCMARLTDPRHRCNHRRLIPPDRPPFGDHTIWLRARDGSRWWWLTQPYGYDRAEVDDYCQRHGVRWTILPTSPYGYSTHALLLEGLTS